VNLLLTGSTGFVGRNLLLRVLQDPTWSEIILPVRSKEKFLSQLAEEGIKRLPENVHLCSVKNNIWDLEEAPEPDLVIHCAGLTFSREKKNYFETHVDGTLQLFAQLPKRTRFLVLSSLSAAGPTPSVHPVRQHEHQSSPVSWYGESKLAMEQKLRDHYAERLLIIRPPIILGPRDTATIPLFQMASSPFRMKPGVKPKEYSWISVDDLCEALLLAASVDWKKFSPFPYFVTNPQSITDLELIQTTADVLKKRGLTLRLPHFLLQLVSLIVDRIPALHQPLQSLGPDRIKEILPQRWVADGTLFQIHFEWKPEKTLRETLEETNEWLTHCKKAIHHKNHKAATPHTKNTKDFFIKKI